MEPVAETHVARKPEPSPAQLRSMSLSAQLPRWPCTAPGLSIWLSALPAEVAERVARNLVRLRDARGIDDNVIVHRQAGRVEEKPSLPAVMPVGRLKLAEYASPAAYKVLCFHASQQSCKRGLAFNQASEGQ